MGRSISYPRLYFELLFIGFSLVVGMGLSSAFLPLLAWELDPAGVLVGIVTSAWFLARIFTELPSGFLSDRIGRRKLAMFGLGLSAVGPLICATSRSIYQLIFGRALWGLGAAFYYTNITALMLDMFEPEVRGKAVGTFQGIEFFGSFVGAPLGAYMASLFGYYSVFYFASVMILICLLVASSSKGLKKQAGAPSSELTTIPVKESLRSLKNWTLLVVCSIVMSRMLVMQGIMSTVFQLYLNQILSFDVATIGVIMSVRTLGFCAATFLSGRLTDRFGGKPVIACGLLIEGTSIYLYTATSSLANITLIGLVEGIGGGMVSVTLLILLSQTVSSSMKGAAIGLYRTFMAIGGILGPVIFTDVYDRAGRNVPFQLAALLLVAQIALVISTRRRHD